MKNKDRLIVTIELHVDTKGAPVKNKQQLMKWMRGMLACCAGDDPWIASDVYSGEGNYETRRLRVVNVETPTEFGFRKRAGMGA